MKNHALTHLIEIINNNSLVLNNKKTDFDALIENIGDARFVLMGEATHGTKEFYEIRIELTKRLLAEKNFKAIAIEADWPTAHHLHRFIQAQDGDVEKALSTFKRFPTWMWRNKSIRHLLVWLQKFNQQSPDKVGIYGLDLYSLHSSMQAVISYLRKVDPEAAKRAIERYECFDHTLTDPQSYGYLTTLGIKKSCINEALEELIELQHDAYSYIKDATSAEDHFFAEQNARLIKNAENYYRVMFESHIDSWNVRDKHMTETIDTLEEYLEKKFDTPAKIIIWAHNSHLGDARATEMGERGELNVGQLMRERHGSSVYSIGFSTHHGTVTAADEWDTPPRTKQINPGLTGSYEDLFHQAAFKNFILLLRGNSTLEHYFQLSRLQRAIGVIYKPETERASHYFFTRLPYQFDSIIHIDETTAVEPINSDNHQVVQKF